MRNGDLSNKVSPRIVLVFEGALGLCSDIKKHDKAMKKGQWEKAIDYWDLNELCARRLLWLYHQKDINISIVTFFGQYFATELNYWLNDHQIPVHEILYYDDPAQLGRKIAYMPDLAMVYDPEPTRWLMYGGKGRFLSSVSQIGEGL